MGNFRRYPYISIMGKKNQLWVNILPMAGAGTKISSRGAGSAGAAAETISRGAGPSTSKLAKVGVLPTKRI